MRIELTEDRALIKSVLCHPQIYPEISDRDSPEPNNYQAPSGVLYLAGYSPDLVGVSCFHSFRDGLKFHPNVLPEQRKHSREFINACLEGIKAIIYVEVPSCLVRLCRWHGFKEIERNEKILMRLI